MLLLKYSDHMQSDKVISHTKDDMGYVISVRNFNSIIDTCLYDVMLPYGSLKQYESKVIAENIYSNIYAIGYQYQLMDDILDNKTNDHAVRGGDSFVISSSVRNNQRCNTNVWFLFVRWKDG